MAKTIAVSDEVYNLLRKYKLPGESFSIAIKRAINRGGHLMDIAGTRTITKNEWMMIEKKYNSIQKNEVQRKKELLEKMQE